MLSLEHLTVYRGESLILHDVTLEVPAGKVVCLLGRNGVGKTTLLKSVMGLLPAHAGRVVLEGKDCTRLAPEQRVTLGVGYVPQGREIFPRLTVRDNLRLPLVARRNKTNGELPPEVFTCFPVLKTLLGRMGGDLSGGQQQQLAIGRALVMRPKLLLLDEPTEGIQPSIILEIEEVIQRLKAQGTVAILLVEQYLEFAWRLANLYYVMEKGTIVAQGSTRELTAATVKRYLTV
jgi:urea transport system ATP-binding protein